MRMDLVQAERQVERGGAGEREWVPAKVRGDTGLRVHAKEGVVGIGMGGGREGGQR